MKLALVTSAIASIATAARVETGLISQFTFQQSECAAGTFIDGASSPFVGASVFTSGTSSCPSVEENSIVFENAYTGIVASSSTGSRGANYGTQSVNTVNGESLLFSTSIHFFTLEFWFEASFSSSGGELQELVLFELGNPKPSDSTYAWSCGTALTGYDLRISYLLGEQKFKVSMKVGDACEDVKSKVVAIVAGNDYHVVVNFNGDEIPNSLSSTIWVNAVKQQLSIYDSRLVGYDSVWTPAWQPSHVVYVGSDPFVSSLGNDASFNGIFAFPGKIRLAAIYNRSLSDLEISDNYQAGLGNNVPVAALVSSKQTVSEDALSLLSGWESIFYDHDGDSLNYFIASHIQDLSTTSFGGKISKNGVSVDEYAIGDQITQLYYQQDIQDVYKDNVVVPNIQLKVYARDPTGSNSTNGTIQINDVLPTNDAPASWSERKSVPQSLQHAFNISSSDIDCRSSLEDIAASCPAFGVTSITFPTIASSGFGKWYLPQTNGVCSPFQISSVLLSDAVFIDNSASDLNPAGGSMKVTVCYESCFNSDINNCSESIDLSLTVLGNDTVTMTFLDASGLESSGSIVVDVTTLLSTDMAENAFVDEDPATPVMLTLTALDNLCDVDGTVPIECASREKEFTIQSEPLHGKLYTTSNVSSLVTTYPITLDGNFVFFLPDENYFNVDSYPLCSGGVKRVAFSQCARETYVPSCGSPIAGSVKVGTYEKSADEKDFPVNSSSYTFCPSGLVGLVTSYLTNTDLEGNVMGDAIKIKYKVKVASVSSPYADGLTVWVRNVNDEAALIMPVTEVSGWELQKDYPLEFDGAFVQVRDSDTDTRIIQVSVTLANGLSGTLKPINTSLFDDVLTIVDMHIFDTGTTNMKLIGTISQVNLALTNIQFRLTGQKSQSSIKFTLEDISDDPNISPGDGYRKDLLNSFTSEATIILKFVVPDPVVNDTTSTRVALYSGIAAAGAVLLGCMYGIIHCMFRRALQGERAALWFVNNVLLTHVDDSDFNRKVDPEVGKVVLETLDEIRDERVRMERVQCCAHAMNILPCFHFKFDSNVPKDFEETMQKQAAAIVSDTVARKHIPSGKLSVKLEVLEDDIFNWEKHIHVDEDGNERPYYFNIKTNESSWEAPSVKVRRRK